MTQETEKVLPPNAVGEWDLLKTQRILSRPIPPIMLKTKKLQGNQIPYVPWYVVVDILNKYCPGWQWNLEVKIGADRIFVIGQLTLICKDGRHTRSATGTEQLNCSSYGDPSSNAEAMALRRAAGRFGLGLEMWRK